MSTSINVQDFMTEYWMCLQPGTEDYERLSELTEQFDEFFEELVPRAKYLVARQMLRRMIEERWCPDTTFNGAFDAALEYGRDWLKYQESLK